MGTTANQKLRLKKPNGWFPAGEGKPATSRLVEVRTLLNAM